MDTEYNNVKDIGRTYESYDTPTEKLMHLYYHSQEVKTVERMLKKMKNSNYETLIDLGSSHGYWLKNYKKMGFKKISAVDISAERVAQAKQRGYDDVHACNAYDLPFENESKSCVISNNMLVHVLQDTDKLKIFKEVKRILKKNGLFIFCFANAEGHGFKKDITMGTVRFSTSDTIKKLLSDAGFSVECIIPSFYIVPRIGAHPYLASISTKFLFLITDSILRNANNLSLAKVVYFGVRKK